MNNTEDMERKAFLKLLVNMGVLLLGSGSEISRVEDTLSRIGTAYGAEHMNVFVITSGIIVTMIFPDKREYTVSRRITAPASNHFRRLERLNELSRRYCKEPFWLNLLLPVPICVGFVLFITKKTLVFLLMTPWGITSVLVVGNMAIFLVSCKNMST